jgi:CheY-like chemotaxis protein
MMIDDLPILLAEDDKGDVFLMRRAFEQAGIGNPLFVVNNGQEAVDYLAGVGEFAERAKYPLPGLMFLDLKMPWMDGFDVLAWLRRQKQFEKLRVVMLTSSRLQSDIDKSRRMGAYDYRVKPHEFAELVALLNDVRKSWQEQHLAGSVLQSDPASPATPPLPQPEVPPA